MKKHLPIFMLFARSTLPLLVLILVLMGAAETAIFHMHMNPTLSLDSVVLQADLGLAARVVFLLWIVVLLRGANPQAAYTFNRLQITPRRVYQCHIIYNVVTLLILWGAQAALAFALMKWQTAASGAAGMQSILLTCYWDGFIHSLLPLADLSRWIRNLAYIVLTGTIAAYLRTGKGQALGGASGVVAALLIGGMIVTFEGSMGMCTADWLYTVVAIPAAVLYMMRDPALALQEV